ncbi:DUF262 domain-containing protein [Mesorhizobium sp. M0579]|uniref:DUF262 domain-containing protein n=1 Tax=Mesorhizobium sp. M0579 TaxID=2956962 RepID=UPI00333AE239
MATIKFDPIGIGDLIRKGRLVVPKNQRSYAWEERNVRELLQDLNAEMNKEPQKGAQEYFLGTIVLVDSEDGKPPQVSDGQQRLATTVIILARIRDLLREIGNDPRAASVHQDYISRIDLESGDNKPRIQLNADDNAFFSGTILDNYPHVLADVSFLRASNKRLLSASQLIYDYLKNAIGSFADDIKAKQLVRWVTFIKESTHVVAVTVPNENDAFRLFETLNDRGVKASQVDILKNFFLQASGSLMSQTHAEWTELTGKIEANFPDNDDQLILYLRHLWITKNGHTIEKELSTKIRSKLNTETQATTFIHEANIAATEYIALSQPSHPKWENYKSSTREYINTISTHLKVEQIKPLLFAIARYFSPDEANKAFRLCVSMSVRFLVYGGRGGFLDEHYAARAHDIGSGKISKAKELRDAMVSVIPTDKQFEDAFAVARVSKSYLARYYLRAIDKTLKGEADPEFVANEDFSAANLEHIIPLHPGTGWSLTEDEAASAQQLIGNMTLLKTKKNVAIGNLPFEEKLKEYKQSAFTITNQLDAYSPTFGPEQAKARQADLAKFAIKTWNLKFD